MKMVIRLNKTQHFEKHAILQTSKELILYVTQSKLWTKVTYTEWIQRLLD